MDSRFNDSTQSTMQIVCHGEGASVPASWVKDESPIAKRMPMSTMLAITSSEELHARYELQSILRDSIYGKVFVALDRVTHERVAIKLSNLRLISNGQSIYNHAVLESPIQEAAIMRKLEEPLHAAYLQSKARCTCASCLSSGDQRHLGESGEEGVTRPVHHPHVLPLLAEHFDPKVHWMVMPLQQSEFFDVVLQFPRPSRSVDQTNADEGCRKSKFNPAFLEADQKFRNYFRQMVSGLSFMHAHGVCHLDFSLENLLVDQEGNLKVCDFGVARVMLRTANGSFAPFPRCKLKKPGKLRYMPPEIFARVPFDGTKADVYSLGVTLFCMLIAHPPFEVPSSSDPGFQLLSAGQLRQLLCVVHVEDLVPDSAVDLMQQMLWEEPCRRISLRAIQSHPYYLQRDASEDSQHNAYQHNKRDCATN